ncbi:amino acid ABC transporter permease [Raineyella fluvialis]|uniref:ABC transporter permease subunit n=1 Tax=Raineyella fluvialis TaxID=2662261 RepID=A0A5Q2FG75_9ACTN|nr:amino acid ABC transporter permease [Raineyella fluvialis]QGF24807.1 ABC transporter permease subunit [Raineyella fluvialis]
MQGLVDLLTQYNVFSAFWMTIRLTLVSALGALVIGTIIAIMRVSPVPSLRAFGAGYVNIIRNTPLTLIITFCVLGLYLFMNLHLLPDSVDPKAQLFTWAVVGLSVYHATFVAEGIRSGINTVPQGQAEAARAIGLTFGQSLAQVVLPQALRAAITPLGNTFIALTKNTTVVSAAGVAEASYLMKNMIEFSPQFLYAIFFLMALGFVILTLPAGLFFSWASTKWQVQR